MEFILSFLFLGLYLVDYEVELPGILMLIAGAALYIALFYVCYNKTKDFMCACIMMFCHTWQASWANVFGEYDASQITWFYLTGVLVLLYACSNIRKLVTKMVPPVPLAMFLSMFILMLYPLIPSPSMSEAVKEFLMIAFFFLITFITFLLQSSVSAEKRKFIVNSYLFAILLSCFFLLVQYVSYKFFGVVLFDYSIGNYYGNALTSSNLLMGDTSCSTIMIGAALFYLLERLNKKNWHICLVLAAMLMAGIGVTTRRTSIVSLAIVLVFYVLLHYKGAVKRLYMTVIIAALMSVMFVYLYFTRSINNVDMLMYSNGRFEGYIESLKLIAEYPFGVGYDNKYIQSLVGGIVPHNSMLRWADMGGILFALLIGLMLLYFISIAYKKTCKTEFWFLVYATFASNLIPDILNARLLIVPVMMVFLFKDKEEESLEENTLVQPRNKLQSRL